MESFESEFVDANKDINNNYGYLNMHPDHNNNIEARANVRSANSNSNNNSNNMRRSSNNNRNSNDINNNNSNSANNNNDHNNNNNSNNNNHHNHHHHHYHHPHSHHHNSQRERLTRLKSFDVYNCKFIYLATAILYNIAFYSLVSCSMSLPDGIENILGFVPRSSFQCVRDGYFGDIENDCRLFHLCQKQILSNGQTEWRHWTYACGNQTMFNQLTLTCAFVDEAIPCKHASQFQYLNEVIHRPREPFLTDADVTSGFSYYSNRIMSDGARARAFEDSSLLAQLGGSNVNSIESLTPQDQPSSLRSFSERDNINQLEHTSMNKFDDSSLMASTNFGQDNSLDQLPLSQAFQSAFGASSRRFMNEHDIRINHQQDNQANNDDNNNNNNNNNQRLFSFLDSSQSQPQPQQLQTQSPFTSQIGQQQQQHSNIRSTQTSFNDDNQDQSSSLASTATATTTTSLSIEDKPTESFNFALTTNHQLDSDSPIVSVVRSSVSNQHAFSFPPPAAPIISNPSTVSPQSTSPLSGEPEASFTSERIPQNQAQLTTTTTTLAVPTFAQTTTSGIGTSSAGPITTTSSLRFERDRTEANAQDPGITTTTTATLASSTNANNNNNTEASTTTRAPESSSTRPRTSQGSFRQQQHQRRRHFSSSFESTRISSGGSNRQASNSTDTPIIMRRHSRRETGKFKRSNDKSKKVSNNSTRLFN